jgi:inosine/xanthosine triphosphatase
MKRIIIVGSTNPVKINSVLHGFKAMFPQEQFEIKGISIVSGVPDQPEGDEETFRGARQRTEAAFQEVPDADFCVGIEGGIEHKDDETQAFAWVVIRAREGKLGKGRTATFFLPKQIALLIREGKELSAAVDEVFGKEDSKHHKLGSVGFLSGGVVDREGYYAEAVKLALIPFRSPDFY